MTLTAIERTYQLISQPQPSPPKPQPQPAPAPLVVTRDDVATILERKRMPAIAELEAILANAKELKLTKGEREQLALLASISVAASFAPPRVDPFVYRLDYAETPVGLLHNRAWFDTLFKKAAQSIRSCKRHCPPRCECWRDWRTTLYDIRKQYGDQSPEAFIALRIWQALEDIEIASRPEPAPGIIDD